MARDPGTPRRALSLPAVRTGATLHPIPALPRRHAHRLTRSAAIVALAIAAAFPGGPPAAAADPPAVDLTGLWTAKQRFGPEGRGPLVIERTGTTFTAEMMGRTLPVAIAGGELSFELPAGQGRFRGRLEPDGGLRGHWYPPPSVAMGGHATPVRLAPAGRDRWRGRVEPFDDDFTFHLRVLRRPDGSLGALLRNPERDFGAWLGVDRLTHEGGAVRLHGRRPGQTQDRVNASGTYHAEDDRITLDFPSRGGSYDFRRDGDHSGFYARGRHPGRYVYRPPPARDDGWRTGTLAEAGIDRAGIERIVQTLLDAPMDSATTPKVHALLIARHGRLVLEEYFHGEHRDRLHETRSAAKSITAVLVGAAIQAGAPITLASRVYEVMHGGTLPADLDPGKRAMTLEHLLTMSAGFHCDDTDPGAPGNEDTMLDQTREPDFYRYTLEVPMASAPGERAVYCSGTANLALGMLGRATGESPLRTFDRLVARPLGIERYGWPLDPAGQPYGGGGVQLLARDFIKFGQLMLDGGRWHGRAVLGRSFVERASAPLYHLRGRTYGLLWWSVDYPYKDRTVRAFYAGGAGGQAVTVIPELGLVVATYGGNYSSRGTFHVQMTVIPRDLLPAVREPGDDPNAPVAPREDFAPKTHPPSASGPVTPGR